MPGPPAIIGGDGERESSSRLPPSGVRITASQRAVRAVPCRELPPSIVPRRAHSHRRRPWQQIAYAVERQSSIRQRSIPDRRW